GAGHRPRGEPTDTVGAEPLPAFGRREVAADRSSPIDDQANPLCFLDTPAHRADSCGANRCESIPLCTGSNNTMTLRRSRWAVAVFFFINGAVLASWVPHIPAVKSRHMLTDGALGLVLLSMAAGSVLTLPIEGV